MNRWPLKPLSELCDVEGGNAAPQGDEHFNNGTIPFVRMKDLGRYHFTKNLSVTDDKLTEASAVAKRMKFFEPGCILFPRSGSVALNHRAILGVRACIVSHIGVLHNFRSDITPEFLYLYLTTFDMTALSKKTTGVDSIAFADVKRISIPVPPLKEQVRIVKRMDEADGLRQLRTEADHKTIAMIPALFHEMFGDPATNPRAWPIRPLGELIADGPQNGLYKHSSFYGDGVPILRIDAFYEGYIEDIAALKRLRATTEEVQRYSLRENDIVINRVNSPNYLGKSALIPALAEPTVFESNMMRFSISPAHLDPDYLNRFLQTSAAKQHVIGRAKHAINQSSINQEDVRCMPVPVPPIALQKEFSRGAAEIRGLEIEQAASRERLDCLFRSMLHRAFNGEL